MDPPVAGPTLHDKIAAIVARTSAELEALIQAEVEQRVQVREQKASKVEAEAAHEKLQYRYERDRIARYIRYGIERDEIEREETNNPEYIDADAKPQPRKKSRSGTKVHVAPVNPLADSDMVLSPFFQASIAKLKPFKLDQAQP